jgi:hypothetical protein
MFSKEMLTKIIDIGEFGLDDVPRRKQNEIMEEIGEYIKIAMLDIIGEGKSPVTGRKFNQLTEKYSDKQKQGDRTPNMDLDGDMLDSLDYKVKKGILEIGWFDEDQAAKAFGHTTGFEGHPWLDGKVKPRPLIPDDDEDFSNEIMEGIREIIEEHLSADQD